IQGVPTFPELLRRHGFTTFATGKWHNGEESFVRSFALGRSIHFGGMDDHTRVTIQDLNPDGTFTPKRIAKRFSSEEFADRAIEFLKNPPEGRPFLAYVAFTAPHDPRNPPTKWRERYYSRKLPLPRNYLPQHPFDNGQLVLRDENLLPWPRPPELLRDQLAEYYGLISHLDTQVGRILDALQRSPYATNTYIIYAADHGLALGSHGLLGKQNVYEHSMRCPLIITGPGVPAGGSTTAFTYLYDLFPTICALTDTPLPAGIDGLNLEPLWSGRQERLRDSVFLPYLGLMRAVRDSRWKLICYPEINHRQLFDLEQDPDERLDVSGDPDNAAQIERLLTLMHDWQQRVGDSQALTSPNPKPRMRDLTGQARAPDEWQPHWVVQKYFELKQ
ncbi:MAG TPA: sulfatase-like hydrolase/transferase, partial [Verrucomicrobiota bacterium]|nr:sulfatase-like hydrolase/transferase [Verrucomicrobiota bacterium]